MTTEGPPPGDRTLSHLIAAAAGQKCPYCKAEPQVPCTWPRDKYHVARFKGIGMTEAERHSVEAATRPDLGHTSPNDTWSANSAPTARNPRRNPGRNPSRNWRRDDLPPHDPGGD